MPPHDQAPEGLTESESLRDFNAPDSLLPPELQEQPRQTRRGQVSFDPQTGRAVVTFFRSANATTAPHELFHIFRREMERTALAPDASAHAKAQWRRLNEHMGIREGQGWTVEQEESFANSGLRYLMEGKAPSKSLADVFERLKRWFMEIYQKAEDLGVEISPQMRQLFDEMFTVPYERTDISFRRAVGELHSREVERDFADAATSNGRFAPEDEALLTAERQGEARLADDLLQDARARAEEAAARLERDSPELREMLDEASAEIAEIDREIAHVGERDEFRRQAVECIVNGG